MKVGLRLSEVAKLKLEDIIWDKNLIKVDGKGQKERLAPLTEYTKEVLNNYWMLLKKNFYININNFDILIRTIEGYPANKNTISLMFRRLRQKTGINIHPHLLRHTFATMFLMNGGDIANLQIILGHTTLHMVLNYVHLANQLNVSKQSKYSPMSNIGQKPNSLKNKKR